MKKEAKTCCQCSLPAWRGMFCPVCGATSTAECLALSLSDKHNRTLGEIGEVLAKTALRTMWESGGPITKPIARTILSCLPRSEEIWHKADECRRKLSNRLTARQDRMDKANAEPIPALADCPL